MEDEKGLETDPEVNNWFTLRGLVGDIRASYRFEPFKSKFEMLFKASEFTPDVAAKQEIFKHVTLRNCIQHHGARVTEDALQQAGTTRFVVLGENKEIVTLRRWQPIEFSLPEIENFRDALVHLAQTYYEHSFTRLRAKHFVPHQASDSKGELQE